MHRHERLLRLAGAGVFLMGVAALAIVVVPAVSAQAVIASPNVQIRTLSTGASQIGADFRDVDAADVTREGLDEQAGAVITEVRSESPAARAGFRAGDVVITFDGERVRSARHLGRLIDETPDGRAVDAVVVRAGERVALAVAPEAPENLLAGPLRELRSFTYALPRNLERFEGFENIRPRLDDNFRFYLSGMSPARLGVTVNELTDQLADYFGASGGGVLITEVADDSPASRAGLKAGDVVTRVGNAAIRSSGDLQRQIREASGEIELTVVRDRREQTLRATIERREGV